MSNLILPGQHSILDQAMTPDELQEVKMVETLNTIIRNINQILVDLKGFGASMNSAWNRIYEIEKTIAAVKEHVGYIEKSEE